MPEPELEQRFIALYRYQRDDLTWIADYLRRHGFPDYSNALTAHVAAWDAAPADTEETVRETLNGYLPIADTYPAAEEVLSALRFYDRQAREVSDEEARDA